MSSFREMIPERLFEKILNFKTMNILYIILKHVVWRFRIYNYFCEIFKFSDFMNNLRNFAKSVFAHIFEKFEYSDMMTFSQKDNTMSQRLTLKTCFQQVIATTLKFVASRT